MDDPKLRDVGYPAASNTAADGDIIELYHKRDERAIRETLHKYGTFCHTIAERILGNRQDAEECVNDTCLRAWSAMPPERPTHLKGFLGAITRHLALDRLDHIHAAKRGGKNSVFAEVSAEFWECLPDDQASVADEAAFRDRLDRFLGSLTKRDRVVFLQRYFYACSVAEIAERNGMQKGAVKTLLCRTRAKLKDFLEKEGISI